MPKLPTFCHTEKTGGASVAEYFGFQKGEKVPAHNACVDVTYYGQHGKQMRNFLKEDNDQVLITLRDPAERLVSAFNWKKNKTGRDYDKDLTKVIEEGLKGPAPAKNFDMNDWNDLKNIRLKPYAHYWDGLELDDPRIKVVCMNKDFGENMKNYAKELKCANVPDEFPVIHKATHSQTTIEDNLRNKIYETRAEDKKIFDHFCSF